MPRTIILSILSAFLSIISYPQINQWLLAWIALVPLLFALDGVSRRRSFWTGFGFGFLFFFGMVGWLVYVTYPGAILLCCYLAFYTGVFALLLNYFQKIALIPRTIVLSSCWVALEWLRSWLFTGFGWVFLGHSQAKNLWMIQIADTIGVLGISFLVILVNLVVFETLKAIFKKDDVEKKQLLHLQIITALILLIYLGYGLWVIKTVKFSSSVKVAVIQPNIPQHLKWEESNLPLIMDKNLELTDQVALAKPDIIVWPETSLPGVLNEQPSFLQRIQLKALDLKMPIMFGSIMEEQERYYNSAVLVGSQGTIQEHYHKIHLVPFGEFLPLRPLLGWINHYIGLEDFTSGHEYKLFKTQRVPSQFGVLICFEDTINDLARNFTLKGAEFLVNMTNDAWFLDTKQPFLHMQQAVFQSVQNRRSLVRSANTGVSGFIDPMGRIFNVAQNKNGKKTFVTAVAIADVPINQKISFYTKFGDFFAYLCFVCILWGVVKIRRENA